MKVLQNKIQVRYLSWRREEIFMHCLRKMKEIHDVCSSKHIILQEPTDTIKEFLKVEGISYESYSTGIGIEHAFSEMIESLDKDIPYTLVLENDLELIHNDSVSYMMSIVEMMTEYSVEKTYLRSQTRPGKPVYSCQRYPIEQTDSDLIIDFKYNGMSIPGMSLDDFVEQKLFIKRTDQAKHILQDLSVLDRVETVNVDGNDFWLIDSVYNQWSNLCYIISTDFLINIIGNVTRQYISKVHNKKTQFGLFERALEEFSRDGTNNYKTASCLGMFRHIKSKSSCHFKC